MESIKEKQNKSIAQIHIDTENKSHYAELLFGSVILSFI
jgi:hypothetical protein